MIGSWITMADPTVSEITAKHDWDFLVVDMQHSTMSDADMENHLRNIQAAEGILAYVRIQENTSANIGRALDAGADGLIVPNVNSVSDAWKAVEASVYGKGRGMGLWRSNTWGAHLRTHPPRLIVQIEDKDAAANIESIMAVTGVDGFLIGMYDLSASIGKPGDFEDELFRYYLQRIDEYAATSDKLSGIHIPLPADYDKAASFEAAGYFIVFGLDTSFLWQGMEHFLGRLHERRDNNSA